MTEARRLSVAADASWWQAHEVGLTLSILLAAVAAEPPATWVGLDRGPLAPRTASKVERAVVAALGATVDLRDTEGRALGPRAVGAAQAAFEAAVNAAIDAYLDDDHTGALAALDRADELYDRELAGRMDPERYDRALQVRAEAAEARADRAAVVSALTALRARGGRLRQPSSRLRAARSRLRRAEPRAELRLDPAEAWTLDDRPLRAVPPGRHHLARTHPGRHEIYVLDLTPGERRGPPPPPARPAVEGWMQARLRRRPEAAQAQVRALLRRRGTDRAYAAGAYPGPGGVRLVLTLLNHAGTAVSSAALPLEPFPDANQWAELVRRARTEPEPEAAALWSGSSSSEARLLVEAVPPASPPSPWPWLVVAGGVTAVTAIVVGIAVASSGPPDGRARVEVRFP